MDALVHVSRKLLLDFPTNEWPQKSHTCTTGKAKVPFSAASASAMTNQLNGQLKWRSASKLANCEPIQAGSKHSTMEPSQSSSSSERDSTETPSTILD